MRFGSGWVHKSRFFGLFSVFVYTKMEKHTKRPREPVNA